MKLQMVAVCMSELLEIKCTRHDVPHGAYGIIKMHLEHLCHATPFAMFCFNFTGVLFY